MRARGGHQRGAVIAERPVGARGPPRRIACASFSSRWRDLGDRLIARGLGHAPHPIERPEEIDRRGPRGGQPLERDLQIAEQRVGARWRGCCARPGRCRRRRPRRWPARRGRPACESRRPRPPSARRPARAPDRAAGADRAGSGDRAPSERARCTSRPGRGSEPGDAEALPSRGWGACGALSTSTRASGPRRARACHAPACRARSSRPRDAGGARRPAARPGPRWPVPRRAAPRPAR